MTSDGAKHGSDARIHLVAAGRPHEERDGGAAALLAALAAGDRLAALVTYRRYQPLARRILRRILGPAGEIDDLVQEVFLRIFERAHTVTNPRAFAAFVMAVASRTAQSELRRRFVRRWVSFAPDGDPPDIPVSGADPPPPEAVRRFYRGPDHLRANDRPAFVLRYMGEPGLGEGAAGL